MGISLLVSLRFLLHQLEAPWRLNRSLVAEQRLKLSMLCQHLADISRDENLRTLLPLVHHLFGCIHLVAVKAIQHCDADNGRLDARMMGKRCEDGALHFDVNHAIIPQLLEVGHLVGFAELTEGTIQASLSLIEVVCALRLANEGVIGIIGAGQGF